MYKGVSNKGVESRFVDNLSTISPEKEVIVEYLTAMLAYSVRFVAIISGRFTAFSRLAATREANVVPGMVSTGTPARSESLAVVWAL